MHYTQHLILTLLVTFLFALPGPAQPYTASFVGRMGNDSKRCVQPVFRTQGKREAVDF